MQVSFDLISDLHIETWNEPFDWTGMATSMLAIVAGDISKDRNTVVATLEHISQCYKAVIYVDGNDEHRYTLDNLDESYQSLSRSLEHITNLVFLKNSVVVIDGVAFLGSNAWWTFDFGDSSMYEESKTWFKEKNQLDIQAVDRIEKQAFHDVNYLVSSVKSFQTQQDVKQIVMITHTIPNIELVNHDMDLEGSHRLNCGGNSHLMKSFVEDTEGKIHTWCFGHYHSDVDRLCYGVRFVNNCKGRGNTPWCKHVYNPKKIVIDV